MHDAALLHLSSPSKIDVVVIFVARKLPVDVSAQANIPTSKDAPENATLKAPKSSKF